jgi:hypothetical protein
MQRLGMLGTATRKLLFPLALVSLGAVRANAQEEGGEAPPAGEEEPEKAADEGTA